MSYTLSSKKNSRPNRTGLCGCGGEDFSGEVSAATFIFQA
jgi:hypothetical protein